MLKIYFIHMTSHNLSIVKGVFQYKLRINKINRQLTKDLSCFLIKSLPNILSGQEGLSQIDL